MTPDNHISELAERVERASGADRERELDEMIAAAVAGATREVQSDGRTAYWRGNSWVSVGPVLPVTASFDSAMALLPDEWKLRQMNFSAPCADDRKWHLNLHGGSVGEDTFVGRGATPALALCAAALRALATGGSND